jgi:hypothetical protein
VSTTKEKETKHMQTKYKSTMYHLNNNNNNNETTEHGEQVASNPVPYLENPGFRFWTGGQIS